MKKQWGFILAALMAMVMGGCGGGGDSSSGGGGVGTNSGTISNYSVSGTVMDNNNVGLAGVHVTLSGSFSSIGISTDSNGNYSFSNVQNGSYTVTPTIVGYTFSSASQSVTVNGANVTGNNFSATTTSASAYSISGTITSSGTALAGVTVTLSGSGSTTATTDNSGNFSFINALNGSYTITPSKAGYTFSPATLAVTVNGANATGKNFMATASTASTYSITGTITSGGVALGGVTVSTSGGSATTDASGNYTISGLANGSFTVTPAKTGYTFSPATLAVTVNGANLTGKNFTATTSSGTSTGTVQLPKTGQTVSYAAGDDGALQKGVAWPSPRFTDNGNGTVTDNLTGLIWLKNANCFNTQKWTAALISANTLSSGACGLTDSSMVGQWRLSNINELESLVDISRYSTVLPSGHPFTSVQSSFGSGSYWSSSSDVSGSLAWIVDMISGTVAGDPKGDGGYVWPVRAGQSATIQLPSTGQTRCYNAYGTVIACSGTGQDGDKLKGVAAPPPRFSDNANGTVTDNLTGLIWLKNASCFGTSNVNISISNVNILASGACGLSDGSTAGQWRLPNRTELMSLLDRSKSNPALSSGHPFTSVKFGGDGYLTSSRDANNTDRTWIVWMDSGVVGTYFTSNYYYVWPVRGGQ